MPITLDGSTGITTPDLEAASGGSATTPPITVTGDTNTGIFFPAADTVGIATGGTERARFNSTGALVLGGGSTSASGVGIAFPATQSASSDANTLDDYEEGTFTPTISAGSGSITSYTSSGTYTKVGRTVVLNVKYTITNNGTGATYGVIGNFPFTADTNGASGATRIAGTTGSTCAIEIAGSATSGNLYTYNNAYPWATNANSSIVIVYQTT